MFDPMWRNKRDPLMRKKMYAWLSQKMGLPFERTHIGMFTETQCMEAMQICKENANV